MDHLERVSRLYDRYTERVIDLSVRSLAQHSLVHSLSIGEINCMWELAVRGALTIGEVGAVTHLSKAAASQLVQRLVQRGLLERNENPHNRRQKQVCLSQAGRVLIQELIWTSYQANRQLLLGLPEGLLDRLEAVLTEVDAHITLTPSKG